MKYQGSELDPPRGNQRAYDRKKAKPDSARAAREAALVLPDTVSVAVGELAGDLEEGLLAFVVGAGLKVVNAVMEHEVEILAGAKGRHDPARAAVHHGNDDGVITLGGRQVAISRPGVRSADRSVEVPLATYDCFASTQLLGRMAMEKMLAKISTRHYAAGLEPVGAAVETKSRETSRSAVSRRSPPGTAEPPRERNGQFGLVMGGDTAFGAGTGA